MNDNKSYTQQGMLKYKDGVTLFCMGPKCRAELKIVTFEELGKSLRRKCGECGCRWKINVSQNPSLYRDLGRIKSSDWFIHDATLELTN